ncbi:hypothetical protein RB195_016511 [Necator americanus]|uniref:Uncharacterized protein n=1 Tax=Necator americanus TaxID=51031 RepID=A0ABR1C0T1_NECAM
MRSNRHLAGFWQGSAIGNVDKEYDLLVEHLSRLHKEDWEFWSNQETPPETLDLVRLRAAARAAGNREIMTLLAMHVDVETCGCVDVQLNLQKTMFVRNG